VVVRHQHAGAGLPVEALRVTKAQSEDGGPHRAVPPVLVLAQDQESVSRRFASRDADRFKGIGYREGKTGAPLIDGALAYIECRVVHSYAGGDHTIFVGQVEASEVSDGKPLLYFRGGYSSIV